nr:hypothetical protein [Oscillibacter sp.]
MAPDKLVIKRLFNGFELAVIFNGAAFCVKVYFSDDYLAIINSLKLYGFASIHSLNEQTFLFLFPQLFCECNAVLLWHLNIPKKDGRSGAF